MTEPILILSCVPENHAAKSFNGACPLSKTNFMDELSITELWLNAKLHGASGLGSVYVPFTSSSGLVTEPVALLMYDVKPPVST